MEEHRNEYQNLNNKFDLFQNNFTDLKIEVRESAATVKAFMDNTIEYRKHICSKLDVINSVNNKVSERLDRITQYHIDNIPFQVEVKNHIKNAEKDRLFRRDKSLRFMLIFSAAMFGFMFWFLQTLVSGDSKIKQEVKVEEKRR